VSQRPENIAHLTRSLADLPRGKTTEQSLALEHSVSGSLDKNELKSSFAEAGRYDGKLADADVESKLETIDWTHDPLLLFTGRIISAKGIHGVIAALPLILAAKPDLRLVIVGHGPLREPMEALIHALSCGDKTLVRNIIAWGRWLEGLNEGAESTDDLVELTRFFETLSRNGQEDSYFETAKRVLQPHSVIFTGYLTHKELRFLFPCADAGVFPSIVREAGPLVFLEALASGCFPLGTYFGGMAASIDSVSRDLPSEVGETMQLRLDRTVEDLIIKVPRALELGSTHKSTLARIARERYDWTSVAKTLKGILNSEC
jgi:glycosyltransferase involved in cell wall biosynthesis